MRPPRGPPPPPPVGGGGGAPPPPPRAGGGGGGKNQLYGLDVLHDEAESAAHVNKAHNDGLAELSFKDKSDGVFFIHADA